MIFIVVVFFLFLFFLHIIKQLFYKKIWHKQSFMYTTIQKFGLEKFLMLPKAAFI